MEIRVLGCYGGADRNYRLTSFLINGRFAVDAGALTDGLSFDEQKGITDIYISHTHMDHIAGLPFFVDNIFGHSDQPVRIHAHGELLKHLQEHLFNDIFWPDFSVLPSKAEPTVEYVEIDVGSSFSVNGLEVLPVWVDHIVPNAGIIVTENGKSWIYPSDTSDTNEIWRLANNLEKPRLLFLECSYPDRFRELAKESKHLTPETVAKQLRKLNFQIPTRIYHCKPDVIEEISKELADIDHPDLKMMDQDAVFRI